MKKGYIYIASSLFSGMTVCSSSQKETNGSVAQSVANGTQNDIENIADKANAQISEEEEQASMAYSKMLVEKINTFVKPEFDCCQECLEDFLRITWDRESKAVKNDYALAKNEYTNRLLDAVRNTGFENSELPEILVGDDYTRFM